MTDLIGMMKGCGRNDDGGGDDELGWDNDGGDEFLTIDMMGRMRGDDAGDNEDEDGVNMWMMVMMVRVILGMMQVMKWDDEGM